MYLLIVAHLVNVSHHAVVDGAVSEREQFNEFDRNYTLLGDLNGFLKYYVGLSCFKRADPEDT